jgi:HEAT repeat protein
LRTSTDRRHDRALNIIYENVRAVAVRSLGGIDAEASKKDLLWALNATSDYFLIRVYAAEALAKTKDSQVPGQLQRYAQSERDSYVRQQFEKSEQELKQIYDICVED